MGRLPSTERLPLVRAPALHAVLLVTGALDVMDGGERPDPARVAALRAAVLRAERGEGTPDDARELAALARWLWEQFAGPLSARDAALYYQENRCLFEPPTGEEAAAEALLRRLLG